ncbi:hypothetical protein FSP39_008251 [Pinctada imbricata]|uniref:G-protein coupled receptors family 1 profile domain-containing protein n=1 Tax=Pinctada imbricata TaxID=66713 RepID=A0AA89CA70_PINIB|nr:hypothetical protein FSP39_008251 [Pinctada imbricata]
MIGCCFSMPFEIVDESSPYTFTDVAVCKIFRYLNTSVGISTGLVLVLVATERYRKICHPSGRQLSERASIYCICAVIFSSFVLSSPALHLYGLKTAYVKEYNLTGTECTWGDYAFGTTFGYAYFGTAVTVLVICMISMSVLYILVGLKLRSHGRMMRTQTLRKNEEDDLNDQNERQKESQTQEELQVLSKSTSNIDSIHAKANNAQNSQSPDKFYQGKATIPKTQMETPFIGANTESDKIEDLNRIETERGNHANDSKGDILLPKNQESNTNVICISICGNSDENEEQMSLALGKSFDDKCQSSSPLLQHCASENVGSREGVFNFENKSENGNSVVGNELPCKQKASQNLRLRNGSNEAMRNSSKDSMAVKVIDRFKKLLRVDSREKRVTKILFTITMLFIFSFLPYIIILVVYSFDSKFREKMTSSEYVAYLMSLRLYNINNAANSILYVLFDLKFRKELKQIYGQLWQRLRSWSPKSRCIK